MEPWRRAEHLLRQRRGTYARREDREAASRTQPASRHWTFTHQGAIIPRLDDDTENHTIPGGFSFAGTKIDKLGATSYTLVTVAVDASGSMAPHVGDVADCLRTIRDACARDPRSENLLVRVVFFSSHVGESIREVHGFIPLSAIDPASYKPKANGGTPLLDAIYSSVGASLAYGQELYHKGQMRVNSIVFVVTDGMENTSSVGRGEVERLIKRTREAVSEETLDSAMTILIGFGSNDNVLRKLASDVGLDQYVAAGDATAARLAKLAQWISRSVSSTSRALGTGGPSQSIAPTI